MILIFQFIPIYICSMSQILFSKIIAQNNNKKFFSKKKKTWESKYGSSSKIIPSSSREIGVQLRPWSILNQNLSSRSFTTIFYFNLQKITRKLIYNELISSNNNERTTYFSAFKIMECINCIVEFRLQYD